MTEQEAFRVIKPLLEGYTEGLFWDFKEKLSDTSDIIKDILAFSNSNYDGDSYIIVGVSEGAKRLKKLSLSTRDRARLNTTDNYLYLPSKWIIKGLPANEIANVKNQSKIITDKLKAAMLIGNPECEFIPIQIKNKLWLYLIVIKKTPGVFVTKKDVVSDYDASKIVVKQGVLYVRIADTTIGADPQFATATEHIRVWKKYIDWLRFQENNQENAEEDNE
jgi:hypothetical protein